MSTFAVKTDSSTSAMASFRHRFSGWWCKSDALLFMLLALFACVPYLNTLVNGFVYDDDTQLLSNPYVRSFHYLKDIFAGNVWSFTGAGSYANYYRPLMTFGYVLCHAAFGFRAYAFHLVNLAFNLGVVWLVFIVTQRMFRNRLLAFVAAGLFALHPIHTEAVDWIGAVTDLQLTFFFLLTFWFFMRLEDSGGPPASILSRPNLDDPRPLGGQGSPRPALSPAGAGRVRGFPEEPVLKNNGASDAGYRETPDHSPSSLGETVNVESRVRWSSGLKRALHHGSFLYLGMTASYVLALLSKEPAATLPFLATFFEHTCRADRARTAWHQKLRRYGVLWIVLIGYITFRIRLLGAFVPSPQRPHMPYNEVFFSAVALVGQYLAKTIWPLHLCLVYVFPKDIAALLPSFLEGVAALLASALLMIYFWKRDRRVCFGFVWFFCTLAPVLNVRWMPAIVFSERYLYLPSVGFCWIVAWAGVEVWNAAGKTRSRWRYAIVPAGCALAALLAARILTRNPDWKNNFTLYTKTLAFSPDSAIIRNNLGIYYADHGNWKAAGEQWNEAYQLMPTAPFVLNNLGLLNSTLRRYEAAAGFYERCIALSPENGGAHAGLGEVYQAMGMQKQAEMELRKAIAFAPLDMVAREHLGQLYFDEGKYALAEQQYRSALASIPTVRAYTGLGAVKWSEGDHAGAQRLFTEATELDPRDSRPYVMLGVLYAQSGKTADAIREYEAGLAVDPRNSIARSQLAKLEHQPPRSKLENRRPKFGHK
jgi:tetratricopeptide (TPR) repeat protein